MGISDLIKPGLPLEADGQISICEIETGKVVAQYQGLQVHEKLEAYKKFDFIFDGNTWVGMIMDSIISAQCQNCGVAPHVTVDDDVRCCICGMD